MEALGQITLVFSARRLILGGSEEMQSSLLDGKSLPGSGV